MHIKVTIKKGQTSNYNDSTYRYNNFFTTMTVPSEDIILKNNGNDDPDTKNTYIVMFKNFTEEKIYYRDTKGYSDKQVKVVANILEEFEIEKEEYERVEKLLDKINRVECEKQEDEHLDVVLKETGNKPKKYLWSEENKNALMGIKL